MVAAGWFWRTVIELAGQIAASHRASDVIAMLKSGKSGVGVSGGFPNSAYLMKPVGRAKLRSVLIACLDGRAQTPNERQADSPVAAGSPAEAAFIHGLRVLLAEDNPVNQRLALRVLEKRGHKVQVACNGIEAVSAMKHQSFDVVLMDVQMPEVDGFEATATIRELEKGSARHTPIIAMTAHALNGDKERCLEAGMDAYIAKPIRFLELLDLVARCAAGNQPGGLTPAVGWKETQRE
jgi:two-component system, sensor histidine kinase and response regulator